VFEAGREGNDGLEKEITFTSWETNKELSTAMRQELQEMERKPKTQPMTKVRKLQRALYRQAKRKPEWRAWTLYGNVCSRAILTDALSKVIANGGGPGVDGMRVEELKKEPDKQEQLLKQLEEELRTKTYKPQPIRRVYIPKANGKRRPLGIPTVRDRVVQNAVMTLLGPIFEADFHENSYAYRPQRRAHQAMETIRKAILSGRKEIVDADISNYFDMIPHAELMNLIAKRVCDGSVLKLIKGWLKAPIVEEDKKTGHKKMIKNRCGTPQGGVISPLLANLYLDALDKAVNAGKNLRGVMVRFADDSVIFCQKGRGAAMHQQLKRWLERRKLKLNEEKTRIVDFTQESFEFLGFRVSQRKSRQGKQYPHVEPSPESCKKMRTAIREETTRSSLWKEPAEVFKKVNQRLRGWSNYYHYGNSTEAFSKMQKYTRDRMRRWLWKKHGKMHGQYTQAYSDERLHNNYHLYNLPLYAAWKHS
jgi:group II intron reverse transcriptase/maturase